MNQERFAFRFEPSYRRAARAFGIRPDTAWVSLGDDRLDARFGPWRVTTPLSNITAISTAGPYDFWKTAGPARLAVTDRGLTFATNGERGVLIEFATAVRGLDPLGLLRHPESRSRSARWRSSRPSCRCGSSCSQRRVRSVSGQRPARPVPLTAESRSRA